MAMGARYPAIDVRDGRASRFTRPNTASEGSRPQDVRSDNDIAGRAAAEKAQFDVRRTPPERARPVGGPDLAVTDESGVGGAQRGRTVSTVAELTPTRPFPPRRGLKGSFVYRVVTTTDPKLLGIMYTVTSVGVLHGRRVDGAADALRARRAGFAVLVQRAVQPAVHHARHDHAAAVCDPDRVRLRQLHSAAADRRTRRGVPAAQRAQLLALPVRRADHGRPVSSPQGVRRTSAGRPTRR